MPVPPDWKPCEASKIPPNDPHRFAERQLRREMENLKRLQHELTALRQESTVQANRADNEISAIIQKIWSVEHMLRAAGLTP